MPFLSHEKKILIYIYQYHQEFVLSKKLQYLINLSKNDCVKRINQFTFLLQTTRILGDSISDDLNGIFKRQSSSKIYLVFQFCC